MANGYKQVDGQRIQLTDEEQKEFESRDFYLTSILAYFAHVAA